jgi:hypothetical protein
MLAVASRAAVPGCHPPAVLRRAAAAHSPLQPHSPALAAPPQHRVRRSPHHRRTLAVMASAASAPPALRIGFLGAGMMAEALAKGFVSAGVASAASITATDLAQARKDVFAAAGMAVADTSSEVRCSRRCVRWRQRRSARASAASHAPRNPNPLAAVAADSAVLTVRCVAATQHTRRWLPAPTCCSCASSRTA